jgi:hypothetical protein
MTQENLGDALQALGERESSPAHLEAALTAYGAVLGERMCDRVLVKWAITQKKLGNLFWTLGDRGRAVAAFWAAFDVLPS